MACASAPAQRQGSDKLPVRHFAAPVPRAPRPLAAASSCACSRQLMAVKIAASRSRLSLSMAPSRPISSGSSASSDAPSAHRTSHAHRAAIVIELHLDNGTHPRNLTRTFRVRALKPAGHSESQPSAPRPMAPTVMQVNFAAKQQKRREQQRWRRSRESATASPLSFRVGFRKRLAYSNSTKTTTPRRIGMAAAT